VCDQTGHFKVDCPYNPYNTGALTRDEESETICKNPVNSDDQKDDGRFGMFASPGQVAGMLYGENNHLSMMSTRGQRSTSSSSTESEANGSEGYEEGTKRRRRKRRGKGTSSETNPKVLAKYREQMEHDLECLRQDKPISEPQHPLNVVHIPVKVQGICFGALVDTGATVSVVSERVAGLLEATRLAKREPANMTCELFGDGNQKIRFKECMKVDIQIFGRPASVKVMVMKTGMCDVLIGHDVLSETMVCVDYGKKAVTGGTLSTHSVPFSRRIDMLRALLSIDECCKEVERCKQRRK
jgi:hypothetical protein